MEVYSAMELCGWREVWVGWEGSVLWVGSVLWERSVGEVGWEFTVRWKCELEEKLGWKGIVLSDGSVRGGEKCGLGVKCTVEWKFVV